LDSSDAENAMTHRKSGVPKPALSNNAIMNQKDTAPAAASEIRQRAEALLLERSPPSFETLSPEEAGKLLYELQVHQIELEMQNEDMHRQQVEMDASRSRYFDLYDLAPVGYLTVSESGLVLEANFTAAGMLGVSQRELVKQPFWHFIMQADQDVFYLKRKELIRTGRPQAFELTMRGPDKEPFWAHLVVTLAAGVQGAPELRIVLSDTSASKQAEERLRDALEFSNNLIRSMQDGFSVLDPDGVATEANPALCRMTGFSREELIGSGPPHPYWPPEEHERIFAALGKTMKGGPHTFELTFMRQTGERFPAIVSPFSVLSKDGTILSYAATVTDISERKHAQEALTAERNLLHALVDLLPTWIFVKDRESRFLLVNKACAINMGAASPEEMVGKTDVDYYPPEIAASLRQEEVAVLAGTPMQYREAYKAMPDGSQRILQIHKVPLRDRDGTITGLVGAGLDITGLKEAEAELRASEAFQRDILNSLPAHIAVLDAAGVIVEVNEPWLQFARLNGTPPIERIGVGANYLEVCHTAWLEGDPYAQAAVAGLESVVAGKQTRFSLDYPCDSPECARWFAMEVTHLGNGEGAIVAHTDISERKQAEEALRDANQKLRLHFEQTPMAVIEWDLDFRVTQWNPAARTIFGYSREEALGQHASFIISKTFHHQVDEIWQALLRKSGGERSTNPNVSKDGTPILCEWYNTPLIDERGTVRGVASVVLDITAQTHALQLLAWEKSALESINSSAPLATVLNGLMLGLEDQLPDSRCSVLLLDADGIHLRTCAAPSLPEAYNLAVDGITIGPTIGSCGTAAYLKRQVIVADIATDPLWADYREVATHNDLQACWSTPILCSQGNVLGTFANYYREPRHPAAEELELIERAVHVMRIAIERKRAEEEIHTLNTGLEQRVKERTAELQAANASLTDFKAALDEHAIVAITDVEGAITYANDKFCEISKYSREELLGRNHRLVNSGYHSQEYFRDFWETIKSGRVWKGEIKNRAKDDSTYWVSSTIVPFLGPDGKPSQFISIRTDITMRKLAEEKINNLNAVLEIRAAALEAANKELEAFSYSVSHDLRAPLRALDGFSRMVLEDYAPKLDDEGRRMLGVIHNAAQRMGQLIDDLLAFSRLGRQPIGADRIDMEKLARDVSGELAGLESERQVRFDLQPLPATLGTEAMIRQVWVNLIGNALKFTKEREVAEIEIGVQEGESGGMVYYVKDNGVGFDMRYVDKLFGVFQRLHSQQEFPGTGVGLALVQRIVQRHGGRIWAEAEINRGATFYFTLPNQKR
jgi:PAS domain S-box-containing protein